ncbi:MAG: glycosyltransferase family 2 protein [Deltaproteobacteria bacterium]|nr:glycosyltransferase family 2 protein [Deltaproteobacteria bacterium]
MAQQEYIFPRIRVAILLCTMNGQRFLGEQLDSIAAQTFFEWQVWASDDGSQDGTLSILDQYRSAWGEERLFIQSGPGLGCAANFLSLACRAGLEAEYYAFADQDDIWEVDKLRRAVTWLETLPSTVPALYCSRTRLIDEVGRDIGLSPLFSRPPGFANALVQNIGGGNTMVFNRAARALLLEAGPELGIVAHDWWAYLLVTGCGGRVLYDPLPSLRYRQHDNNLVGANTGWQASRVRMSLLVKGRFKEWNARNLKALQEVDRMLLSENRRILKGWTESRGQSLLPRLLGFNRAGIYRQTLAENLGLLVAVLFRRM